MRIFLIVMAMLNASAFGNQQDLNPSLPTVPKEVEKFIKNWDGSIAALQQAYNEGQVGHSSADRLLRAALKTFSDKKYLKGSFTELALSPRLKEKLLKERQSLSFEELSELLNKKDNMLSDDDKFEMLGLFLLHLEKTQGSATNDLDGTEAIVKSYLDAAIAGKEDKLVPLSQNLAKFLGVPEEKAAAGITASELRDLIFDKKKGLPNTEEGLGLLNKLVRNSLNNPENLDLTLRPFWKQLYNAGKREVLPNEAPETFQSALRSLYNLRFAGTPVPGGNVMPFINGGGRGKRFSQPKPGTGKARPSHAEVPPVGNHAQVQACVDKVKEQRYNVELSLPGAGCAGTTISKNPEMTEAALNQCTTENPNQRLPILISTATHCVEGIQKYLLGKFIGVKIAGAWHQVPVQSVGNPDFATGQIPTPIEGGAPDMSTISVMLTCQMARLLSFAQVPSPREIRELASGDMTIAMQQNSAINADQNGRNAATIGGSGRMEVTPSSGDLGNYVKFNTNSSVNNRSSATGDDDRIKPGDSGGTAVACKFDPTNPTKVEKVFYLGDISHIDVTGNQYQGQSGGIGSGASLLHLSEQLFGKPAGYAHVASATSNNLSHVVQ